MEQPTQALRTLDYVLDAIQKIEIPCAAPSLFGSEYEMSEEEKEVAQDTVDLIESQRDLCSDLNKVVDHGGLVDIISVVKEIRRINKEAEYLLTHLTLNEKMEKFRIATESAKAAFNEFLDYIGEQDINIEFIIPTDPPCTHGDNPCDCVIN